MKEKEIVAIYCRLSKEDLDKTKTTDESESIQNQKLLLVDYATNNGFLIHNVYVDEDLSGFSDRPAFKQMIKDAADGQFNIVLCKHQSRFTRDMELVEKYIHGLFQEWGIRFISLTDNVDTNVKGNKKARQIYGLINEWYSEDLSQNIRAVFRRKMEEGQFIGSFACYGYIKDPNDRHKLVIDEEAATVVREIFELYLCGHGSNKIASILTIRGILTPTQYKKSQGLNFNSPNVSLYNKKHGVWGATTIKRMLSNTVYIGTLIQGRERKLSYKSKKVVAVPEDEWVVVENNHEPIIELEVFKKAQQLIRQRYRKPAKSIGGDSMMKPHLLAGKIKCADCGSTMERGGLARDGTTHYLRCKLASKTRRRDCSPHLIRQSVLEASVLDAIRIMMRQAAEGTNTKKIISDVENALKGRSDPAVQLEQQVFEVNKRLEEVRDNLVSTYKDKLRCLIDESDFLIFKESFEEERLFLEKKLKLLEGQQTDLMLKKQNLENISVMLEKYTNLEKLTHEIINDFVEVIRVSEKFSMSKKQEISIAWNF